MSVRTWIHSLTSTPPQSSTRRRERPAARRLFLEGLEDRRVMAFNVLAEYATGANPSDVALAPINAGGQPDLLVASAAAPGSSVRLGNADGTFNGSQNAGSTASSVATGDLTGDGVPDLVGIGGTTVSVQKGNGDGTFQLPQNIALPPQVSPGNPDPAALPQSPLSVATGDLNADGKLDLVVAGQTAFEEYYRYLTCGYYGCGYIGWWTTHTDGYVNVLLGNGSGGFAAPVTTPLGAGTSPTAVAIGDLNGDAKADVLTGNSNNLSALLGNGTGGLAAPVHSGYGSAMKSLPLGDLDGDGRLDTVARYGDYLYVQKGQGNGTFTASASIYMRHQVSAAVMGDVNGDGKLDLAAVGTAFTCTDSGYYGCYNTEYSGQASVILGTGTGSFSLPIASSLGTDFNGWFSDAALADLTGDGRPDLVTIENVTGQAIVAVNDGVWVAPVMLSISSPTVLEGNSGTVNATFTVTLGSPTTIDVKVDYATADLDANEQYWYGPTATAGIDYTATAGTLTIPAGQTTGTIVVPVIGDRIGESGEMFFVKLSNPTHVIVDYPQAVGTITDDEPYVSIQYFANPAVAEGNTGTKSVSLLIELSTATDVPVTVSYTTNDGSAVAGSDYQAAAGTLTIAPGQTTQTVTVQVVGDTQAEDDEYFTVSISNATNATLGNQTTYQYIQDDDRIPAISISDASVYEGNNGTRQMTFTVTLSQPSNKKVRVNYATANGTAKTSDSDYVSKSGTITFNPGQTSKTITVTIKGDKKKENDEYFYVNLSGASGAPVEDSRGEGWIFNDDWSTRSSGNSWVDAFDLALEELLNDRPRKRGR